jgi:hypothetical protein
MKFYKFSYKIIIRMEKYLVTFFKWKIIKIEQKNISTDGNKRIGINKCPTSYNRTVTATGPKRPLGPPFG